MPFCASIAFTVNRNVIVVGGGIAGLTAAIYLARGGANVTLFEKKRHLGGRGITHLRQGFRFNLGPHAVYRAGHAARIYREIGIPIRGGVPKTGGTALLNGHRHTLPVTPLSILTSSLLPLDAKFEAASLLFRLRRMRTAGLESMTVSEWLDANVRDASLRKVIAALMRVATYSADGAGSAKVAVEQLKLAMRGVIYVDEGWQKLVDSLHSHAVTSGVNFVTSSRVVGIDFDADGVTAIELGGLEIQPHSDTQSVALPEPAGDGSRGTRLPATTVVLAVDPMTAADLVGPVGFAAQWKTLKPVTLSSLDVALSRLPNRKALFAVGIEEPYYYSVHSAAAQLAPYGGAMIHVAKYRQSAAASQFDDDDGETTARRIPAGRSEEMELEGVLDKMQPGWRDLVVHRRFLPSMTVTHALPRPDAPRPAVQTPVRGLYLAGDWVGDEGALSDAALASARTAARLISTGDR